jgi:ribosomal protein S12 methylthiotransferase
MKVGVISLGCPKNLTDTEAMLGLLVDSGYEITTDQMQADIMIINTCAFIGDARNEAFEIIKENASLKIHGKLKYLVVVGCLPKRYKNDLFDRFEDIDAIVGPGSINQIIKVLKLLGKQKRISLLEGTHCLFTHTSPKLKATPKYYAYIKIADGCDNKCSYCMVPYLRGKFQSRPMGSIVSEVKDLVKKGLQEAILIAQDTTMYGSDLYGKSSLHTLCKKLARIGGLKWIRIMYAHPAHVTDELIETIKKEPKICRYLDLPIQHACDKILTLMKRRISAENLKKLVEKLRRKIPGLALRTSVIVGFPGETDEDFEELYRFVKESKFTRLGVFKYSRESGTPAAKMRGQISEKVKEKRFHKLMYLQREISKESLKKMIGKVIEVLAEGNIGRSFMDAPGIDGVVKLDSSVPNGKIVPVRITGSSPYDLSGKLVT